MTGLIYAQSALSIRDFKKDPLAAMAAGGGGSVAVLMQGKPFFYCVPAGLYEAMIECLDDQQLRDLVQSRRDERAVRVNLDDL